MADEEDVFLEHMRRSQEMYSQFVTDNNSLNRVLLHGGFEEWLAEQQRRLKPDEDVSGDTPTREGG